MNEDYQARRVGDLNVASKPWNSPAGKFVAWASREPLRTRCPLRDAPGCDVWIQWAPTREVAERKVLEEVGVVEA